MLIPSNRLYYSCILNDEKQPTNVEWDYQAS